MLGSVMSMDEEVILLGSGAGRDGVKSGTGKGVLGRTLVLLSGLFVVALAIWTQNQVDLLADGMYGYKYVYIYIYILPPLPLTLL